MFNFKTYSALLWCNSMPICTLYSAVLDQKAKRVVTLGSLKEIWSGF